MQRSRITACVILAGVALGLPNLALAADSQWVGPGSDFNTAGNWSAGVPTNDNAIFNSALPTNIGLSADISLSIFTFNPGAAAYTFAIPNAVNLTFMGGAMLVPWSGIMNNSTNTPTLIVNNGGALTFTGGETAGNAAIQNSGTLTFDTSCVFFCVGATAGNATITNAGLLVFSGLGTAGNATIVNVSTVQITTEFNFSGTLGNATVVNNGLIDATGAVNDWSVGSIEGPGALRLPAQTFAIGSNGVSTTISGAISGSGVTFVKTGTGRLTLSGINTYTGQTSVNEGELRVLGSLATAVALSTGAVLSGTGIVSDVTNRGTLSPGVNGAGTLTIGNYSGGGALNILISGASVPNLKVLGAANVTGGTLTVSGSGFAVGQYKVLESNALTGTFSNFSAPSSLFAFTPLYTTTDLYLRVGFATPFVSLAQNPNQKSLAANLEELKTASTSEFTSAITGLAQLSNAEIPAAYDQISGDALASFQEINLQNTAVFTQGMRQRAVSISSGSYGIWAQGLGWTESADADAAIGSPKMKAATGGFQAGYDVEPMEGLVVGITGGYGNTSLDVLGRSSSGDTTSIHSGLYAGYHQDGWFTDGTAAWTSGSNRMTRSIRYGSVSAQGDSRFESRLLGSSLETGYAVRPNSSLMIQPSAGLRYTHLAQEGFSESGGTGLDLTVDNRSVSSWISSLGAALSHSFGSDELNPGWIAASIAWEREWAATQDQLSMRFTDVTGGSTYAVEATPRPRHAAVLGLHAQLPLRGTLALVADYNATLASARTVQSLFGGVRWKW